ncbi:MAG: phosphotransferase system HPr (HPr) family protein [Verrucomicrobiales bacterium]|jgi:phosphotransferase system HPr (HPr) family protein
MEAETNIAKREFTILNKEGLHLRPAGMFVKLASTFKAEVWVEKDGETANGKSIMGLALLAAERDSKISITTEGEDAALALEALGALVDRSFQLA